MPIYAKLPSFDAANVASKLPEPMQHPAGMALEALKQVFGGDTDPTNVAPTPLEPVAAPLISIFKDAAGVPSQALREAGTQTFLDMARSLPHRMRAAAESFAQDYPRVAAHMRPEYGLPSEAMQNIGAAAYIQTPPGQVTRPMAVRFTPVGRHFTETPQDFEPGFNQAKNYIYHEGTHAAQALGNKDMADLYNAANQMMSYDFNPFELRAERAGSGAQGNILTAGNPTAIEQLRNLSSMPGEAARRINDILQRRAGAAPQQMLEVAAEGK